MLRPFLFIGVGGSGGKTLWTLRDELRNRLDEAGYTGDIPAAWQFLHIDVPTFPDGADPDLGDQLPPSNYVGLVSSGIVYRTIDHALTAGAETNRDVRHALVGWRPDPQRVSVPVEKGAGQFRTLGRVITSTHLKKINDAIRAAADRLQGAEIATELAEVSKRFGAEPSAVVPDPVAIVVSSMAGGSGAGAVLDVCDVLRSTDRVWADRSFGFMYAPDVFDALAPSDRKGVQANALATLSEIMAGFWNHRAPNAEGFEEEFALFARSGITVGSFERRGPRYPIIIGNSNGDVTFTQQNDVYRATGKALAAWTVSPKIQDFLGAFFETNYSQSASDLQDRLPLHELGRETPFSAVGFGRISLGRDQFARYSSERLARGAVDRLLRRHEEGRIAGQQFDNSAAIEELVVARAGAFLAASGLNERGEDHNDVLDALRPPDRDSRMDETVNRIVSEIVVGLDKGAPSRRWTELAVNRVKDLNGEFMDGERNQRLEQARLWTGAISGRLTNLAAQTAARDGLPVAISLLDRLDAELQFVLGELPSERENRLHYASKMEEFIAEEVGKAGDSKITPANPQIRAGVQRGVECMVWRAEADLRELAIELLNDVKANLVRPLREALKNGMAALAVAETQKPGAPPSIVASWPDRNVVPARFTPSPNERLLLSPAAYSEEFSQKVIDSCKASDPDGAFNEAVMALITGEILHDGGSQILVSVRQQWHPNNTDITRDLGSGTNARFDLVSTPEALLERARSWVGRSDTAFGSFVGESLQSYLAFDVEPAELDRRLTLFRSELMSAVDAAKPLVDISPQVLSRTHGRDKAGWRMLFTEIPFPAGTRAREITEEVLVARGQLSPEVKAAFGEGNVERIDMFTVLDTPVEPVVFSSIMRPIADEWAARSKSADAREEFWRLRRSRPLSWFIPTTPDVREAMVRGWFTARALGQLTISESTRTVEIYVPEVKRMLPFPNPLIGAAVFREADFLPAVLESIPLAMLDFYSRADGEMATHPYARLRELGANGENSVLNFSSLNLTMSEWISRGVICDTTDERKQIIGAPVPAAELAGSVESTPEERRTALVNFMRARQGTYSRMFAADVDMLKFFQVPRVWELRTDITNAFVYILRELEAAIVDDGPV